MQRFGTHRSVTPRGTLPQQASVVDPRAPLVEDEIAIDVEYLNIDSASWRQIREAADGDVRGMAEAIRRIVSERGKMHNPVTGSGGMLVGRVSEVGSDRTEPSVGTKVASLASLSLTPLVLEAIEDLDPNRGVVKVKGRAILFGSSPYCTIPADLPEELTLEVLDVCGAPAWMARLAAPEMSIAVLGAGGKSGMLACAQAVRSVGSSGRVLGLCWPEATIAAAADAGAETMAVDCTDAIGVLDGVTEALNGELADIVFVCTNVPGCEGGAILACSDAGRVVFFSMATSFTSAALIAEGLGKTCELTIGNGYVPGHAELALDLVRQDERLRARFES